MIVAFWAAVGKVALKVLQFLVGDKKGRKFLGYVIGITLFIVLLPVIAIYGLFGWMSGGEVAERACQEFCVNEIGTFEKTIENPVD